MLNTSARPADGVESVLQKYGNMLYRICIVMLADASLAEDALQDTMLKFMQHAPTFENAEHQKAWLIKVATNNCKDILKSRHRTHIPIDTLQLFEPSTQEDTGVIDALMSLPEKFRIILILHYMEEYKLAEIAEITGLSLSAVKMRLQKGRKLLEQKYRKEFLPL